MSDQGAGGAAVADPPAEAPAPVPPPPSTVRLPVAVLAVLAAVVVALLAVSLVVRLSAERLPTGPPRDPPAAPAEATTFSIEPDRTVRFQELSLPLPGPPYTCGDPQTPPPGFSAFVACEHVVHPDYDAAGDDWSAVSGVLLVADPPATPGDLRTTTRSVFDALVAQLYTADDHFSLSKVSEDDVQVPLPPGRSATRRANVDVHKRGLATPYDRLVVVVVPLDSGRYVAFFSDFPHDGDAAAVQAVGASIGTLSLRR